MKSSFQNIHMEKSINSLCYRFMYFTGFEIIQIAKHLAPNYNVQYSLLGVYFCLAWNYGKDDLFQRKR